jgi:Fe-S cluster biogenesis protein NfuA
MVTREHIESILARVRPSLVADGGDIELVDVIENSAVVRLSGVCGQCPTAHMTLHLAVETALREAIPDLGGVRLE